jgi:hypothetical protein
MLTTGSIEERVWETLRVKKSLFAGVFDSPTGEVSFAKLGRKTIFQTVKEIFADQPLRPKPMIDAASPEAVPLKPAVAAAAPAAAPGSQADGIGRAAAGLLEAGVKFIEAFVSGGVSGGDAGAALSGLYTRDAATNRPVLSIPLPESLSQDRFTMAISGLLSMLRSPTK